MCACGAAQCRWAYTYPQHLLAVYPMGHLTNLAEWGLTAAELPRLSQLAAVQIQLKYPDYKLFVQFPPPQRIREIDKLHRRNQQRLLALLPAAELEPTGTARRPTGVKTRLPLHELPQLLALEFVDGITIDDIAGMEPQPVPDKLAFWSVEARFAVQIEGETTGLQLYEDRLLIILADSEAEAKRKLTASFAAYAKPYLNSAGRLVRWQFEAFLDVYRAEAYSLSDFASDQGVEAFSRLRRRRLRPDQQWQPEH